MEQFVNFIIRPPRAEYDPKNDLLDQEFMLKGKLFQRKDLEIKNSRGDVLQCSHYVPIVPPEEKALPCVIYCHGNSGCRADASEAAIILLPSNITVFTLDFSGSGISGGDHVTLGWNEKDDLRAVVNYLREDGNVSLIGLWGRSMGAVTSLMYGAEDPSIAGMVLDSPFSDLVDLMMELVDTYKIRLPKFTIKFAIQYMRRAILKKAKFDIEELNTIKVAKSSFVPVLFGHAVDDDFIQPHHSDRIFDAYVGDKNIIKFDGDHNSPRPQFYFDSVNIFFHNVLQPPEDEVGAAFSYTSDDYFGKGSWSAIHDLEYAHDFLAVPPAPVASSTADAISQLRTKRPMSKMEVPCDISSKDKQSAAQEEGSGTQPSSTSSKMINFELSNGHLNGPHVPVSVDDEDYLEYSFDDMPDIPSNVDEEERMFMEAIIESLKDLETRHPQSEEPQSSVSNKPSVPSREDDPGDASSMEHRVFPTAETPMANTSSSTVNDMTSELQSPDSSSSAYQTPLNHESMETGSTGGSTRSDKLTSFQSSSETDVADGTKATVTVVKNPASNIMDGLLRRWDLNFFKSR